MDVSAAGGGEAQRLEVCSAGGWRAIATDDADGAGVVHVLEAIQIRGSLRPLLVGAVAHKVCGSCELAQDIGAAPSAYSSIDFILHLRRRVFGEIERPSSVGG